VVAVPHNNHINLSSGDVFPSLIVRAEFASVQPTGQGYNDVNGSLMVEFPPLRKSDCPKTYQVPCWAIAPPASEVSDLRPLSYVIGAPTGFKKWFRGTVIRVHLDEAVETKVVSADVLFHDFDFFPRVPASRLSLRNVNEEATRNMNKLALELCSDEMAELAIRLDNARKGLPDLECQLVGQDQRGPNKRRRKACSRCKSHEHCITSCPHKDTSSVLSTFKFSRPPLTNRRVPTIDEISTLNSFLPRLMTITTSWVLCDTCKFWRKHATASQCQSNTFVCADMSLNCSEPRDHEEVRATEADINSYPLRRQFDEGEESDDSEAPDNEAPDNGYGCWSGEEGVVPGSNGDDEVDDAPFWADDLGEGGTRPIGGGIGCGLMEVDEPSSFEESDECSIDEENGQPAVRQNK